MSLFYRIAAALGASDLERAMEQTLALAAQELGLDAAWIWLIDEREQRFYLAASYDLPPYLREPLHMTGEPCWCMSAFFDGDFVSKNVDIVTCSRLQEGIEESGPGATRGLRSHASVALRFGNRELGLFNAARLANPHLTDAELEVLTTIGAQLGVAIERSRLAEEAAAHARSEERAELARELHDTVVQDFTAILLQLERGRQGIDPASAIARNALETLRRNVDELRDDPLQGEPLAVAVARIARGFTSETGIIVSVDGFSDAVDLPPDAEFAIVRIVSEALSNIARHSDARRVACTLKRSDGSVRVRVVDDGRGFDLTAPRAGFGLEAMRQRAEAVGAVLRVESKPASGTTVELIVPANAA
jgi:two-component system, NarL family, sensor kinase